MPIETAAGLVDAIRSSGLLTRDQVVALAFELETHGGDFPRVVEHIVKSERLTHYQLRKLLHGKVADLCIGPYTLLDRLGAGGMGKVYRSRDRRDGREVALKVIRASVLATPVVRTRYQREVEAARKLRHPNIVAVEDAGVAGGRHYLAMEFVDGIDLAVLTRDHRPLEVIEACEYARQTALGLQHAHEMGFVHRDIKPSNIVVAGERHVPQATDDAIVKILDMGLIRAVNGEGLADEALVRCGVDAADLTRDGAVVGTPDYMAPEQVRNSRAVDHRADLYSLGCTLYFLLTARPPFPTGSSAEKVLQHQFDHPAPLQALRPDVPTEVAAVVARLMAKNPADRFPSAAAAAEALTVLSIYPSGSQAVPIRVRTGRRATGVETPIASGESTCPTTAPSSDGLSAE